MLPDTMPAQFQSTYTPIAAAGTQAQIKHLSRLLATQLTAAGLGRGILDVQQKTVSPVHSNVIQTIVIQLILGQTIVIQFIGVK